MKFWKADRPPPTPNANRPCVSAFAYSFFRSNAISRPPLSEWLPRCQVTVSTIVWLKYWLRKPCVAPKVDRPAIAITGIRSALFSGKSSGIARSYWSRVFTVPSGVVLLMALPEY